MVRSWRTDFSRQLQWDFINNLYRSSPPTSYWLRLVNHFPFMDKFGEKYGVARLREKARTMTIRHGRLLTRLHAGERNVYASSHEEVLWKIWDTIWGSEKAAPEMLDGEEDNEEEKDEDKDEYMDTFYEGSGDDAEEEIAPTPLKGRETRARRKAILKKLAIVQLSPDEDDSPVKATPTGVRAVPPITASAEVSEVTSVKRIEEGKAHRHLESEKLMEGTRDNIFHVVEARVQNSQNTEGVRSVEVGLGSIAGQNGSHGGRWSDIFADSLERMGLPVSGKLPSRVPNNVKPRELCEAEHDLILKMIQLEKARIAEESVHLQYNFRNQQVSAESK